MPKISVIITAHNYAKWLPQAIDSVLTQTFHDFEVVVVDDASTDHTPEVLRHYAQKPNVKIVTTEGLGLAGAANLGVRSSSGEYVIRLDADDYFDENILLVLSNYLDVHPNVGMVFCDYYTVDTHGEIIEQRRRAKLNSEVELLDRPALAAGAMYRRSCFDRIGGYDESLRYQEDYDFWIKFIEKFVVRNVSLPLMYYRMHGSSMSRNWEGRMKARRAVKQRFVEANRDRHASKILAIVPARADILDGKKLPLLPLGTSDLLGRAIDSLTGCDLVDRIVVSTEDQDTADRAKQLGVDVPYLRSRASAGPGVSFESVARDMLNRLREEEDYRPDIILLRYVHSPFITSAHVTEAIDSMILYGTDTVLAVLEDLTYHWRVGRGGLSPVGYQKRVVRQDKDIIYKEVGGLYACQAKNVTEHSELVRGRIGHIEVAPYDALRIDSSYQYWTARQRIEGATPWSVD